MTAVFALRTVSKNGFHEYKIHVMMILERSQYSRQFFPTKTM
jgi:hypothetical protein